MCGLIRRKAVFESHLQGFTLYSHTLQLQYNTSDERTFTVLCSVNTAAHSLKLIPAELICSKYFLHVFVQN